MKHIQKIRLLFAVSTLCLLPHWEMLAQAADAIKQVSLNPLAITQIPVSLTGPTTIRFPSPISDLEGAFISMDANSSAPFLLSFRPGSAFFSVRALVPLAHTSLNVVWRNQTYVFELQESKTPWLSVILTESRVATTAARREPVTPSRLLGLLDTAKAFPLLKMQHPEAVAGIECVRPKTENDYGDYSISTEEVFRFDGADSLVFHITVSNKSTQPMRYLPQSLMVQAGSRIFYQSITDGNGEIPAQGKVAIYFAITGTADGGRNEMSPHNDFLVLLQRVTAAQSETSVAAFLPTNQTASVSTGFTKATLPPTSTSIQQAGIGPGSPQTSRGQGVTRPGPLQPQVVAPTPVVAAAYTSSAGQVVPVAVQPQACYSYPTTTYYSYPAAPVYYTVVAPPNYYYVIPQYYYAPVRAYYPAAPPARTGFYPVHYFGLGYGHDH